MTRLILGNSMGRDIMPASSIGYQLPKEFEGTILADIMDSRLREIAAAKKKWPEGSVRMALEGAPRVRSLSRALLRVSPAVIAEIKRASPSAGVLRADLDPVKVAAEYQRAGAAAISVVTEGIYFGGQLEHIARLRWEVDLPLLRKDFIVDPYQIVEARHAGADAILLIAALLDTAALRRLHAEAESLGIDALVEVHNHRDLDCALEIGAVLIGVNSRNLRSFEVSPDVSLQLAARLPKNVIAVAESGIRTGDDIRRLAEAGYRGFLIGERLMGASSPGGALSELLAAAKAAKGRTA
jgi:indole-3-glycerol phosphate synthase